MKIRLLARGINTALPNCLGFRKAELTLYARYLCSRDALGRPGAARDDRVSCIQELTTMSGVVF